MKCEVFVVNVMPVIQPKFSNILPVVNQYMIRLNQNRSHIEQRMAVWTQAQDVFRNIRAGLNTAKGLNVRSLGVTLVPDD